MIRKFKNGTFPELKSDVPDPPILAILETLQGECTEILRFSAIAITNFHRKPEIAAISGTLLNQETLQFKVAKVHCVASDCDFVPRIPSESRALSGKCPCG